MTYKVDTPVAVPSRNIVAIMASSGLGGGIERYCDWLLDSVEKTGSNVTRLALLQRGQKPSFRRKVAFVLRCHRTLRQMRTRGPLTLLICHPSLALATLPMTAIDGNAFADAWVLFHGDDIWSLRSPTIHAIRRYGPRLLTVSTFSSGALASLGNAHILSPGFRRSWYDTLVNTQRTARCSGAPLRLLTVFRLSAAREKGLPEILDAIALLRYPRHCHLTIAGSGRMPDDLHTRVRTLPNVTVVADPADPELASLYSRADLFVLATRTAVGPPATGEGFGIVLVEAQLTGTPVIAPAHGGSNDAFLPDITGLQPEDQSSRALATVLESLLDNSPLLSRMSTNAMTWARATFEPDRSTREAQRLVLGRSESRLRSASSLRVIE